MLVLQKGVGSPAPSPPLPPPKTWRLGRALVRPGHLQKSFLAPRGLTSHDCPLLMRNAMLRDVLQAALERERPEMVAAALLVIRIVPGG